jgi:hypothetical protein
VGVPQVVDPGRLRQPKQLGRANGGYPVVVSIELVNDSAALGRREHKFLTWPAGDQRDQQLHEGGIQPDGPLAGARLGRANVELVLPIPLPSLVDSGSGGLESKSTSATVNAVASPKRFRS